MLWSIMVDDILGLHGTGVFVRVIEPAGFGAAESAGLNGRDWMRIRREFVPLFALAAACMTAGAQPNPLTHQSQRVMISARAVHNLPPEDAAREIPVHLRAVITYYDPYIDARHAAIFVHDASGGVFLSLPARPILSIKPGTLVDIAGVTNAGDYAPVISSNHVRPVGQ